MNNLLNDAKLVTENCKGTSSLSRGLHLGLGKTAVFYISEYIKNPVHVYAKLVDDELYVADGSMRYVKWNPEDGLVSSIGRSMPCGRCEEDRLYRYFIKDVAVEGEECTITYDVYRLQ